MISRAAVALALLVASSLCQAEIIALCGASDGRSYYPERPPLSADEAGWVDESITSGNLQLIRSGPDWDVVFTDSTGDTLSAKGNGASISGFVTDAGDVVVQVVYERVIETYVFWLTAAEPMVTFSQAKHSALIAKHGILRADCQIVSPLPVPN